jgi:hypothetical protein
MNWQNTEVVDKFNFLGMTLENIGGWKEEKTMAKTEGYRAVIPTANVCQYTPV